MQNQFEIRVSDDWLDYNGHMNLAYYALAFDRAGEQFLGSAGLNAERARSTGDSWMVAEAHVIYQREAFANDSLIIHSRILALDEKRIHLFQQMRRRPASEQLATNEQLILHVNLHKRRVSPFADSVIRILSREMHANADRDWPEESGRHIALGARRPGTDQGE